MRAIKSTLPLLAVTGLVLAGCPSDDIGTTNSGSSGEDSSGSGTTTTTTNTTPPTVTDTVADTTVGMETTTDDPTGATTTTGEDAFVFNETPYEDYTQVDRMGFPAVNTGLNLLGDKDVYNQATPADDAAGMFSTNITESLETLHLGAPGAQTPDNTGLDDDLLGLALDPCVTPPLPMNNCDDQTEPFVIPDVITISLDADAGFPNGRRLADPVMDIIFAVLLIDLGPMLQGITTFIDLDGDGTPGPSLNPLANDIEFAADFPYLAPAH